MIEAIAYALWELLAHAIFGLPTLVKKLRTKRSQVASLGN